MDRRTVQNVTDPELLDRIATEAAHLADRDRFIRHAVIVRCIPLRVVAKAAGVSHQTVSRIATRSTP